MGKIIAVCISVKRGTQKTNVGQATIILGYGLENDAHGGDWHRQISLLSYEKIEEFNRKGAGVTDGAFGENLVVSGIDLRQLPIGTLLRCGDALLQVTQIGKQCHGHCEIYHRVGDCIMPREGIFTKVIKGGNVKIGDEVSIV